MSRRSRKTSSLPNVTYFASGRQFCTNCGGGNLARSRLSGGFSGRWRAFVPRDRRLNGGCSQDWLPPNLCRQFPLGKVSGIVLSACSKIEAIVAATSEL